MNQMDVIGVDNLQEAVEFINGTRQIEPLFLIRARNLLTNKPFMIEIFQMFEDNRISNAPLKSLQQEVIMSY